MNNILLRKVIEAKMCMAQVENDVIENVPLAILEKNLRRLERASLDVRAEVEEGVARELASRNRNLPAVHRG